MYKAKFGWVGKVYRKQKTNLGCFALSIIYKLLRKVMILFKKLVTVLKINSWQSFIYYICF